MRLISREIPRELAGDYEIRGGDVITRRFFLLEKLSKQAASFVDVLIDFRVGNIVGSSYNFHNLRVYLQIVILSNLTASSMYFYLLFFLAIEVAIILLFLSLES